MRFLVISRPKNNPKASWSVSSKNPPEGFFSDRNAKVRAEQLTVAHPNWIWGIAEVKEQCEIYVPPTQPTVTWKKLELE